MIYCVLCPHVTAEAVTAISSEPNCSEEERLMLVGRKKKKSVDRFPIKKKPGEEF